MRNNKKNNILVTIAAREGSKGLKNKNIRLLLGKPLIDYTIGQALAWRSASCVVVTTDSPVIAKIAKKAGAEIPFMRPKRLATDFCSKIPAIKQALVQSEEIYNKKFDIIVDLGVTAPVRTVKDLDNCLDLFLKYQPNTLFSVVAADKSPYFNMVEKLDKDKVKLCKKPVKRINRRQDTPKVYSLNASIYFYKRDYLLKARRPRPINNHCQIYIMPDISAVDIDREIDFKFLEFLLKERIVKL